jgi:tRNA-specific 2-thiouridylase
VKLAELFALAERLGASHVATGHYARITRGADGTTRLAAAFDREKDQSYFLYASPRAWLDRLIFPLGESTKGSVRTEAVERKLPGAGKGESQELCFIGGGAHAYGDFVAHRAGGRVRPGVIVDERGRKVGSHDGIHRFTVGQRKGLGVALGRPAYVSRIDAAGGTVHLGGDEALLSQQAELADVSLAEGVALPLRARVRVRYRHQGEAAAVLPSPDGAARVHFDSPVRAVTRGQIAVLYEPDGDGVLGGGRIAGVSDGTGSALPCPP